MGCNLEGFDALTFVFISRLAFFFLGVSGLLSGHLDGDAVCKARGVWTLCNSNIIKRQKAKRLQTQQYCCWTQVKQKGGDPIQLLLDDVIVNYLHQDPKRIPNIRDAEDRYI